LSDPFRIRDHVADFDAIVGDIVTCSAATRERLPMMADVAYGTGPSETIDLFFPVERRPGMPVHMFIHGGYWRMFSKRDYSCIADTVTSAGAIAVVVDYVLMPSARMTTLVDQIRHARDWVIAHIAEHGGDPERLTISGHSAGAHLACFLVTRDQAPSRVRAALLLGGLYELDPLRLSFLQAEIALTDAEVAAFTPMTHEYDPTARIEILVGADETPPFHQQANDFAERLRSQGVQVSRSDLAGCNHMTSVRDLAIAETRAGQSLMHLIQSLKLARSGEDVVRD
jgi:arylformamidase